MRSLPPLQMTLAPATTSPKTLAVHSTKRPQRHSTPPPKPPPKPPLARRSSSVDGIMHQVVNVIEMRYRSLRDAFRAADGDSSGALTRQELERALNLWRIHIQARHLDSIFEHLDHNGDQSISYSEFCDGLKAGSVRSRPIFGLADRHVTERYRVLPGGNRVLMNDNIEVGARGTGRPDYELIALPHGAAPASPEHLRDRATDLSNRIHAKYRALKDAFRAFDLDKDGKLSSHELACAIRCFNLPIPREHVTQLAALCDADGDGQIDYNEFATALKRKDAIGR